MGLHVGERLPERHRRNGMLVANRDGDCDLSLLAWGSTHWLLTLLPR